MNCGDSSAADELLVTLDHDVERIVGLSSLDLVAERDDFPHVGVPSDALRARRDGDELSLTRGGLTRIPAAPGESLAILLLPFEFRDVTVGLLTHPVRDKDDISVAGAKLEGMRHEGVLRTL